MQASPNRFLAAGAALSAVAALAHLACIPFGAPMYRAMGAGEKMAQMAEAGSMRPAVTTLVIAGMLFVWSLYALAGAGVIRRLPWLRPVLVAITAVYLVRGLGFVGIMAVTAERSAQFWLLSSAICVAIGALHLVGLWQSWERLAPPPAPSGR